MKSKYTGSGATYFGATYFARDSAAYAPDRKRYLGSASSINGKDVTNTPVNVSKAAPVTVTYTFDYPKEFSTIALLFLDTGMMKDVQIKNTAPTAAPAPAPTNPAPAAPAPPSPATKPAPPTTTPINLSAFDIKLTDCTTNGQGGFTCNKAELIPKP